MRRALTIVTHGLGVVAFVYPFFLPSIHQGTEGMAHSSDAPILFSIFGTLLVALAVSEIRAGTMDARGVAVLGILSGLNAVLRLPGSLGGANLMFVLPILCGYAFGARFGFLLGAMSMAVSGAITGGAGPWLPFQMWALGWVGGAAALLRPIFARAPRGIAAVAGLAAYGWISGLVFGALLNVWFWPFLSGGETIGWVPGLGARDALARYWRFYLITSLAWDSARAIVNAALIVALGSPILRVLLGFHSKLLTTWTDRGRAEPALPRMETV